MSKTKVCFKCGNEKELTQYYKHKAMADGHLGKCKECTKKDSKLRETELRKDVLFVESEKKRSREKYHRLNYKEKHKPTKENKRLIMERYNNKYPEKKNARSAMKGLKAQTKGNHLHHWSYKEEHFKDVIEVTEKLHNVIHREMTYCKDKKLYISKLNGELLDTKDKHIAFIRLCKFNNIKEF
jgi:hypothetical protein